MFGNTATRIVAPAGLIEMRNEFLITDSGLPDEVAPEAKQLEVGDLPDDVLVYLLGSRYCETESSPRLPGSCSATAPGWARVQAICDYVHHRITFGYQNARRRTASGGPQERRRLPRLRPPGRRAVPLHEYPGAVCTGYLGDIGVPIHPAPDFAAWFEVYLGGRWYTSTPATTFPGSGAS